MILGFVGYLYAQYNTTPKVSQEIKDHYEMPADDLLKLSLEDISAVDLLPKPDTKNLTFNFKVIPKSKDKFVPLKTKGDLVIIDSVGNQKIYSFDANFDEQGIKPQVISHIILDGLIPKEDYLKIRALTN